MSIQDIATEDYQLCIEHCDFLEEKTIWVAAISNGLVVMQDDYRSGRVEPIAWKRLSKYCGEQEVDIVGMYLKFRSHIVPMPDGDSVQGYYFAYGAHREFDESVTRQHYVCGVVEQGRLNYAWYTTPELEETKSHTRKIRPDDSEHKRLILKHDFRD